MQKFVKRLFVFFLILVLSLLIFAGFNYYVVGNNYRDGYQASIIDKINRLKSIGSPKIVLVGNSNVNFGINSFLIEKEFGIPTVDLGLHGGLGNAFHERIAKIDIGEGDVVVVCHNDYSDDGMIPDPSLAWVTIEYHTDLWSLIDHKNIYGMLKAYPKYAFKSMMLFFSNSNELSTDTPYRRDAFNKYGDIIARPKQGKFSFTEDSVKVPKINESCTNRLNELNKYISKRGGTMLVAGYPIAFGEYTPPVAAFKEFQGRLEESLECDIISDFTDYFLPYDYFYNTHLHLNQEGANKRTEQLIRDLYEWGLRPRGII